VNADAPRVTFRVSLALRLVTWNVNSLRVRLPRVLELLALHPDEPQLTWWELLPGPLPPRHGPAHRPRAFRKGPKPSDHAPLLVELELPAS
jgi:hypothetical protein